MKFDAYELLIPFAILIMTVMLSARLIHSMQTTVQMIPGAF